MSITLIDVKYGKYLIKNVPCVRVGEECSPTVVTYREIAEIIDFLENNELTTYDFNDWRKTND
jgi:hypothetical protein